MMKFKLKHIAYKSLDSAKMRKATLTKKIAYTPCMASRPMPTASSSCAMAWADTMLARWPAPLCARP